MRGFDKFHRRTHTHLISVCLFASLCNLHLSPDFHFDSIFFCFCSFKTSSAFFFDVFFLIFLHSVCFSAIFCGSSRHINIVSEKCIARTISLLFSCLFFCCDSWFLRFEISSRAIYILRVSFNSNSVLISILTIVLKKDRKRDDENNTMNVWCTRYFSFNCRFDLWLNAQISTPFRFPLYRGMVMWTVLRCAAKSQCLKIRFTYSHPDCILHTLTHSYDWNCVIVIWLHFFVRFPVILFFMARKTLNNNGI